MSRQGKSPPPSAAASGTAIASSPPAASAGDEPPTLLESQALFHGAAEVLIRHGHETYRLRQTQPAS